MIYNHFVAGTGPVVSHGQKKNFFLFAAVWEISAKSTVPYDSLALSLRRNYNYHRS